METLQLPNSKITFPNFKTNRKSDRHKLDPKTRGRKWRREKILIQELKKRNFTLLNNNPNFFKNWWHDFSLQASYIPVINKEICFFFVGEGQESYEFAYQWNKHRKELEEALKQKPLLFRKKLKQLDWELKAVKEHWKEHVDIIETINKVPQTIGYNLASHYEKRNLGCLLLKNGEAGGKNRLIDDFDHWHKDKNGNYFFTEQQRKYLDKKTAECVVNRFRLPWYEISLSGSPKIHWNILGELPAKSKLYWNKLVVGDRLGKGNQSVLPISKNRAIIFTKWFKGDTRLPLIKLEEVNQFYQELSLFTKKWEKTSKQVETSSNFNGTPKTSPLTKKTGEAKTIIQASQIIGKELLPRAGQKPLYKVNYLYQQKKKYFLLDTYQKNREGDLTWLFSGEKKEFVINQGNAHQFFYARI